MMEIFKHSKIILIIGILFFLKESVYSQSYENIKDFDKFDQEEYMYFYSQSCKNIKDFYKFVQEYRNVYSIYNAARIWEYKNEEYFRLKKLVRYFKNPLIIKKIKSGRIYRDTVNIENIFNADSSYIPVIPSNEAKWGRTIRIDLGENGYLLITLGQQRDYFYYTEVKKGDVEWEKGFKVKKINYLLKIYEVYYKNL
jgi:hypothetical protein